MKAKTDTRLFDAYALFTETTILILNEYEHVIKEC